MHTWYWKIVHICKGAIIMDQINNILKIQSLPVPIHMELQITSDRELNSSSEYNFHHYNPQQNHNLTRCFIQKEFKNWQSIIYSIKFLRDINYSLINSTDLKCNL